MNTCPNCGQANAIESKFCRFCGVRMHELGKPDANRFPPPSPYSWKTDEHQARPRPSSVKSTVENYPSNYPSQGAYYGAQPLATVGARDVSGNYRCPNCGTHYLPIIERRISTGGWITFALLLVFTVVFCWIGLLLKEDVSVCPVCRVRLN